MAEIHVENLSLHYPLAGAGMKKLVGNPLPENMVEIGGRKYILALKDINFDVLQGQRIGLMGPNGSGKSTLLRVLGGIYAPTSGSLITKGQISSLFNINLGVQADATGRDNIKIRGLIKGWSRKKIADNIDEIIDFSDLRDFIDFPIRTYSDGMRMRLLFAVATSFSPEILLLDEWIGAGDEKFQRRAAKRMNSLVDQAGITVIASHNRNLLKRVCTLGLWLEHGKVKAFDEIDEVFRMMDLERSQAAAAAPAP